MHLHHRLEATRDLLGPGRLIDVRYEDLRRDVVGQIGRIYHLLNLGEFAAVEPAIRSYTDARTSYQPRNHERTGELRKEIHSQWRPYFDRYGYAREEASGDPAG